MKEEEEMSFRRKKNQRKTGEINGKKIRGRMKED